MKPVVLQSFNTWKRKTRHLRNNRACFPHGSTHKHRETQRAEGSRAFTSIIPLFIYHVRRIHFKVHFPEPLLKSGAAASSSPAMETVPHVAAENGSSKGQQIRLLSNAFEKVPYTRLPAWRVETCRSRVSQFWDRNPKATWNIRAGFSWTALFVLPAHVEQDDGALQLSDCRAAGPIKPREGSGWRISPPSAKQ